MAKYPGATQRPLDPQFIPSTKIAVHNRCNLHTQAGNGSLFNFFNSSGKASSHFWVAKSGLVEQYIDTDMRAEADLEGNDATVSIETEGNTEPWTEAQIAAIIPLVKWILDTHGIPVKLAENSFSGDDRSRGISWHRLGIDGNFPELPSRYAGRQQRGGGMHYSNSKGKVCPGEARIDQIFDVVFPGVSGGVVPVPNPIPTPQPPQPNYPLVEDGWLGSATIAEIQRQAGTVVDGELWYQYKPNAQPAFTSGWVYNYKSGKGSPAWAWVQSRLGTPQDGVFGQTDLAALEARAGYPYDGRLDGPSNTVKWLQHALNTRTL